MSGPPATAGQSLFRHHVPKLASALYTAMSLSEIKRSLRSLTTKELTVLNVWLQNLVGVREAKMRKPPARKRPKTPKKRRPPRKTYRLQLVRCGKETCKCRSGILHGPYWYACWFENGRTRSQYIGKKPPKGHGRKPRVKPNAPSSPNS